MSSDNYSLDQIWKTEKNPPPIANLCIGKGGNKKICYQH